MIKSWVRPTARRLKEMLGLARPPVPLSAGTSFQPVGSAQWYDPVLLNPSTIGRLATQEETRKAVLDALEGLQADDYQHFVRDYYKEGATRFGGAWIYADILTALWAASRLVRPERYLEIGVRRGRSLAVVATAQPTCDIVGFDLWLKDYAGMSNPGPEFVSQEMKALAFEGEMNLISGSSHETVPEYFRANPDTYFDLITVDGDHSADGASRDLRNVVPRLKRGGVLVFDDIAHPHHPELSRVWETVIAEDIRFRTWEFRELGFGVGVAVRIA